MSRAHSRACCDAWLCSSVLAVHSGFVRVPRGGRVHATPSIQGVPDTDAAPVSSVYHGGGNACSIAGASRAARTAPATRPDLWPLSRMPSLVAPQFAAYPFDTVRRMMQAQGVTTALDAGDASRARALAVEPDVKFRGMRQCFAAVRHTHGWSGLWRGGTACMLRVRSAHMACVCGRY